MNESEENTAICEGFGCFREATNFIHVNGEKTNSIPLYLCDVCVKIFQDAKKEDPNKRELEQQVVQPACSNISSQYQGISIA